MSISELLTILPISGNAIEHRKEEWSIVELAFGSEFPSDYKELIDQFGPSIISEFIKIRTPFTWDANVNLISYNRLALDGLRELKQEFGEDICPYPIYPEPGGLVLWGDTENGDQLFWRTQGPPSDWKVITNESRSGNYEEWDYSMSGFLVALLTQRIDSNVIPFELLSQEQIIKPLNDQLTISGRAK